MSVAALEQHRRDLGRLWAAASRDLGTVAFAVRRLDVAEARELLKVALPDLMDPFLGAASDMSAVLLDELYRITANVPASAYLPSAAKVDRMARWAVAPMVDASLESTVLSRVAGASERMLYDAARLTVSRGVISNYLARKNRRYGDVTRDEAGSIIKFQRFPATGACDFCKMLASRGAVYRTEGSAGGVVGRGSARTGFDASGARTSGGIGGGVKARGKQQLGSNYHDACRCLVQPVIAGTEVAAYASEVEKRYWGIYSGAFTDEAGGTLMSDADIMARWRELQSQKLPA